MKYETVLAFYGKILEIINSDETELPYKVAMDAIELYGKAKDEISLPEFTAEQAKIVHGDFDVREDYAEAAFKDLAPHLRDPRARKIINELLSCSGTQNSDDVYIHVKSARKLDDDPYGPAIVTLVVHGYGNFKGLLSKDEDDRPTYVHGSFSPRIEE